MNGFVPTANKLFEAMGIDEPMPHVDYVQKPRGVDLNALTEQERKWLAEAEQEKQS